MALTRKSLKAMGLTDEQVDSVIEMHTETVDALKEQRDSYKADAEKLTTVQAELDSVKNDGFKAKYEAEHKAFEEYKADITAKETKTAKAAAVRKYFEAKGITGKSLDIAMRGAGAEVDAVELDDGKLKDTTALDALISGDFAGLVSTTQIKGADVAHPPANLGEKPTKAQIMSIKDTATRQKAMLDNAELFGI